MGKRKNMVGNIIYLPYHYYYYYIIFYIAKTLKSCVMFNVNGDTSLDITEQLLDELTKDGYISTEEMKNRCLRSLLDVENQYHQLIKGPLFLVPFARVSGLKQRVVVFAKLNNEVNLVI